MPEDEPQKAERPEKTKNPDIEVARTSIDTLLELLRVKGKSDLNSIAVSLNIDPRIIENWAKVLENGNLIRITYEVGKMYLEPLTLPPEAQADLKNKSDLTKFILEEDLAVERISLDKFSKNIDQLNVAVTNIEKLFQQKMPDIHRIFAELDKAYEPVEAKKRNLEKIKEDAEKNYTEMQKKVDDLSKRLSSFSPKKTDEINERTNRLNEIMKNIESTQKEMDEVEQSKNKFFNSIESEIGVQMKELNSQIKSSRSVIEQHIRANRNQINELIKGLNTQFASARETSKEIEGYRKEFERAKREIDLHRNHFDDHYAKIMEGLEKSTKLVGTQAKLIEDSVNSIRQDMGEISKLDAQIRTWKSNMSDLAKEISISRSEIAKLTSELNTIDANKNLSIERKAKMVDDLSKEGKVTKSRVSKIKKAIKDTADEITGRIEEKR